MHKRTMLLASALGLVAMVASVAGAVPSDAESSRGPKLDKLHAVRPTAAMSSVLAPTQSGSGKVGKSARTHRAALNPESKSAHHRRWSRAFTKKVVSGAAYAQAQAMAQAEGGRIALGAAYAKAESDAAAAATAAAAAAQPVSVGATPGDFLSCVRNRESGGDYGAHNQGGSGASGAYQFLPSTWDSLAASIGRTDLIGVDPAGASPADQDAMAQALYAQQGSSPWGGAC